MQWYWYSKLPYSGKVSELLQVKLDKVSSSFCKTAKAKIAFLPFKIGQCFSPKDLVHHAREYVSFFEFLLYMISDPSINVGYKFLKNLYCEEYDQFPGCIDWIRIITKGTNKIYWIALDVTVLNESGMSWTLTYM